MADIFHVSRGGVRGGRDQFSWDTVREDKDRECYLGHSLHAPVGRWQKGKDLSWYARGAGAGATAPGSSSSAKDKSREQEREQRREELRRIKEQEAEVMAAALGLKSSLLLPTSASSSGLTGVELNAVLRRERAIAAEDNFGDAVEGSRGDVHGLGFGRKQDRAEGDDGDAFGKVLRTKAEQPLLLRERKLAEVEKGASSRTRGETTTLRRSHKRSRSRSRSPSPRNHRDDRRHYRDERRQHRDSGSHRRDARDKDGYKHRGIRRERY